MLVQNVLNFDKQLLQTIRDKILRIEATHIKIIDLSYQIGINISLPAPYNGDYLIYFSIKSNMPGDFYQKIIQAALTRITNKEKQLSYEQAKELFQRKMVCRRGLLLLTNEIDWEITDIICNKQ